MESIRKVKITNMANANVSVRLDELKIAKSWPKKGASFNFDFETVREALFDIGFLNMIKCGTLYIENKQDRIDLGLEVEGEEIFVPLKDNQLIKLLKVDPASELEKVMQKANETQRDEIAEFAINNKILDIEKNKIIKKYTERDVINTVKLLEASKEE